MLTPSLNRADNVQHISKKSSDLSVNVILSTNLTFRKNIFPIRYFQII